MKRLEQNLQVSVIAWLKLAAPDLVFFAVPNAIGVRNAARIGAINKAMGVRAGVADLCFVLPSQHILNVANVAFIELKAGRGRQTPAQKAFEADCKRVGAPYAVCTSLAEVEGTLRGWGVDLRARVAA